jgi:hypothetical protein
MRDPLAAGRLGLGRPIDYMQGEARETGQIWHLPAWGRWSDRKKIRFLRKMITEYGNDPKMRWRTVEVLRKYGVAQHDAKGSAAALLKFVQDEIYYTCEPGVESSHRRLR